MINATHRWFSGWRSAERPAPDPADFGTAFGLDLSLNELVHAAPARPAASPRRGWMQRLAGRVKTT